MVKNTAQQQLTLTQQWLETIVVGMNLCPFAKPVIKAQSLRYALTTESDNEQLLHFFLAELEKIQQASEQQIATTLVIMPNAVADFYDYLDLLAQCEELLEGAHLADEFQLASFHPGYLFAGVDADDMSHWTNRSPYPILHIIRQGQMSRLLANYPNPESIPKRNIALLRDMGKSELIKRFPPFADYA